MYKCKLIKNYEKLYNNTVAKIVHYGSSIKFDKVYLIVQILCGVITKFLKHLILFFILSAFNFASLEVFIEVMFKCVILDLLFEVIPSPSGVLFYELLFLTLFRNTFVTGYVLYGMVGYRLLTYFVIAIIFAIGCCVGIRKRFNCMNNDLNCTKKDEF